MKRLLWTGVVIAAIGVAAFGIYVLPFAGGEGTITILPNGQAQNGLKVGWVILAAFGLAVGSALIGVGVGRWTHPRASAPDGSPEV